MITLLRIKNSKVQSPKVYPPKGFNSHMIPLSHLRLNDDLMARRVSSLRPELAVIARTLQAAPVESDLLYLCDSKSRPQQDVTMDREWSAHYARR